MGIRGADNWQLWLSGPANSPGEAAPHLHGLHGLNDHPALLRSVFQSFFEWFHENDQLEPWSLLPLHVFQQKHGFLRLIHNHSTDVSCRDHKGELGHVGTGCDCGQHVPGSRSTAVSATAGV